MRPDSGLASPAMQSRSVVFPAPDAPKRIVNPAAASNETLSEKGCSAVEYCLRNSQDSDDAPGAKSTRESTETSAGAGVSLIAPILRDRWPTPGDSGRTQSRAAQTKAKAAARQFDLPPHSPTPVHGHRYQSRPCACLREYFRPPLTRPRIPPSCGQNSEPG